MFAAKMIELDEKLRHLHERIDDGYTNAGSDHFCIRSVRKRSVRQVRNSFHKRIPKADHTCIVYKSFFRQQRSFPVQAQKRVAYDNINCIHYHMPHVFLIALFSF